MRKARGQTADAAKADDAQRLAGDLAPARQFGARPSARAHCGGRPVRAAQQEHCSGNHVFGHCLRVGAGRGDDLDVARFARRHVDVVESDAQPADHPELRGGIEQVAIDLRPVAHDERIRIAHPLLELVAPVDQCRVIVRLEHGRERADRVGIHEFRDDYMRAWQAHVRAYVSVPVTAKRINAMTASNAVTFI